jgi:hypothetical protein
MTRAPYQAQRHSTAVHCVMGVLDAARVQNSRRSGTKAWRVLELITKD